MDRIYKIRFQSHVLAAASPVTCRKALGGRNLAFVFELNRHVAAIFKCFGTGKVLRVANVIYKFYGAAILFITNTAIWIS